METIQSHDFFIWLIPVVLALTLWESVWKIIAMWRSARNNDMAWFISIAIINTIGILPIVYLLSHKKEEAKQNQAV